MAVTPRTGARRIAPGGPMAQAADNARSRLAAMNASEAKEGEPVPTQQVAKGEANYRLAETEGQDCGTCEHFDGESACTIVAGTIKPDYVSDYWESKNEKAEQDPMNQQGQAVPPPPAAPAGPMGAPPA